MRPFLENTHAAIEAWLLWLQQPWREDATNQDVAHTRNRIRWQLLPLLRTFNPRIAEQLARLAWISATRKITGSRSCAGSCPLCCYLASRVEVEGGRPARILRKKQWGSTWRACASCIQPWRGG